MYKPVHHFFYALQKYMQDICTLLTGSKVQKE